MKKNKENVTQKSNCVNSVNYNGKDTTFFIQNGFNTLSLINKLKVLESVDKTVKSLKFMLH